MIKIKDTEYKLKYTLRALFIYERITGKSFKFEGLYSEYLLFFSTLVANNENFTMAFDEFIDICDEDPKLFNEFREWFIAELEKQSLYRSEEDTKEDETSDTKKKN